MLRSCVYISCGDINGDGYADIIVGAQGNDANGDAAGAAYTYHGSSTGIISTIVTTLLGTVANDRFGILVSNCGDINGDGYEDVIVGAEYGDSGKGTACIYHGSNEGITSEANTILAGKEIVDGFGCSASTCGDTNGDGCADAIVGVRMNDDNGESSGAAYIYHGSSTGIPDGGASSANTTMIGEGIDNYFGCSVAMSECNHVGIFVSPQWLKLSCM